MNIQCDLVVEATRPNIVIINEEEKELKITDLAVPGGMRVKVEELEKTEK